MKKQLLLLAFYLVMFALQAQERLIGQVKNAKSGHVLVERPIEGKYLPTQPEKIQLDQTGKFEIDFKEASSGFLLLRIEGQKLRFFISPGGDAAELSADAKDLVSTVSFAGPHAAQNKYLQSLPRLDLGNKALNEVHNPFYNQGETPKETWTSVTDFQESEKKLLKKADKEQGFSADFVKAVEKDIDTYYHSVFGNVAYRHWKAALK